MRLLSGCTAIVIAAVATAAGSLAGKSAVAAAPSSDVTAIRGSFQPTADVDMGEYTSSIMTVEVVLAPSNGSKLSELLTNLYDPNSTRYQQWLGQGDFYSQFAPSAAQIAAVAGQLQARGLVVQQSSSPFLVRASGPSKVVEAAFGTTLHTYRNRKGITYFSNTSAVVLPTSVASGVLGVVGLSNTVRLHSLYHLTPNSHAGPKPSCDSPYPDLAFIENVYIAGAAFTYGYGGGPGCSGLTPSQTNSIYDAPHVGARGQGEGVKFAVFELSAYQHSDIDTWAHQFYGPVYAPPLVDIAVDGGPLAPICPVGDECPPAYNGYSGDIEVAADIEITLALAPAARSLLVYNAPNDYTGQTELDEYTYIAAQDNADVISSSWAACENDVGAAYVQAENVVFEQMAAQGQSMFGAEGDTGAFECIRSDGTTIVNLLDPPAQPWVTSVGGTSFDANPNVNPNPSYPYGLETVWNVDNLCNENSNSEGTGISGAGWCGATGAGGGGNSQYWGRPSYQFGPGVQNRYTTYGGQQIPNGVTQCSLAKPGTPCRETPDISANADEWTGYAEFCTGNPNPPDYSDCGTFSGGEPAPGWFQIGGTSLSSPLWSAIIGDRVGYQRHRVGNANPLLYTLYNIDPNGFFHDITGVGQATNNNGLFPTTWGFDLATGIGSPKMGPLITGFPDPY